MKLNKIFIVIILTGLFLNGKVPELKQQANEKTLLPLPIKSRKIDFSKQAEVMNLIKIIEVYPILLARIREQENEQETLKESLKERKLLEEKTLKLLQEEVKKKWWNNVLFYTILSGIPISFILGILVGK